MAFFLCPLIGSISMCNVFLTFYVWIEWMGLATLLQNLRNIFKVTFCAACNLQTMFQMYAVCVLTILPRSILTSRPVHSSLFFLVSSTSKSLCSFHSSWLVPVLHVHSCQQKSIGLKFSKSQTGSDVRYSCHRNSSRRTFPTFAHSCRSSVLRSLQSVAPRMY